MDERLVLALNEDLHSPLTLAAAIIDKSRDTPKQLQSKVAMLQFLVEKLKQKLWEYGPVTMSVLNLEGIEIRYDVLEHYECAGREADAQRHQLALHQRLGQGHLHPGDRAHHPE